MDKFILRYRGPMDQYKDYLGRIYSSEGTHVLDAETPGLLLVEGDADELQKLVDGMPGWQAYPQHYYGLPEQRPQVKQGPEVKQSPISSPSPDSYYQGELKVQAAPTAPDSNPSQQTNPAPTAKKTKPRRKSK
jgi:hypothetical protein